MAFVGVLVPLISFALLGHYVIGLEWVPSIFLGGIFTATSVGLSVEALKRAGKLETNIGNQIVGAAVIDDILGVIVLTVLAKLSATEEVVGGMNPFVLLAISVVGFALATYFLWQWGVAHKIASYLGNKYSDNSTGIFTRFFFASSTAFAIASETSFDFPNP